MCSTYSGPSLQTRALCFGKAIQTLEVHRGGKHQCGVGLYPRFAELSFDAR